MEENERSDRFERKIEMVSALRVEGLDQLTGSIFSKESGKSSHQDVA